MHRRLWLFASATVASLMLVAAAGAMTTVSSDSASSHSSQATLAAAPFAQSWANVPRSPAARQAKKVLVFGAEQDIDGFNTGLACCNAFWAVVMGNSPVLRGAYVLTSGLGYKYDLATKVVATQHAISYTLNKKAKWTWGKKVMPVTYKDWVYTWKQFVNPKNDVASRAGYDQITGYTHKGNYQVTFKFKKPFADYKDIFGLIYPSAALAGQDFNKIWASCVCGKDGRPVSDGPFILTNYTKGQGVTLVKNTHWYGHKPALNQINFKIITDTNSEIQAMRGGEVDAIAPSPQTALTQLEHQRGLVYSSTAGLYQEHLDLQEGPHGIPLMKNKWFRQAIEMGIDRSSIVKALFGDIAPTLRPLNNLIYYTPDRANYRPDFLKYNFNPKKAIAVLKAHGCTGGPSKPTAGNTSFFTCGGQPAQFKYTTALGNHRRETSFAIVNAQLNSIGIKATSGLVPANVMFGDAVLAAGNYDAMEFAWVTSPDPQGYVDTWRCNGPSNFLGYCNKTVTKYLLASQTQLNAAKRRADFQQADKIMAEDVPSIPLYSSPSILIYKANIAGMANNPSSVGPTWNAEYWRFR